MTNEAKILFWLGAGTVILLTGAVFFLNSNPPKTSQNSQSQNSQIKSNLLVKDNSNKITTDSAKTTIVEFGDYQCPACKMAHPIINKVLKDYPDRVNFVFRHFPLPQHQNAFQAAEAAEAAGEQGKYFEMHNKLYENQDEWDENNNPLEIFLKYAQELNLSVDQFEDSVTSNKYQQKISSDKNDGNALGLNSTPTFFINGTKLNGFSYEEFKKRIE